MLGGIFGAHKKTLSNKYLGLYYGGEAGIRTLGGLQTLAGFQNQCFRPLSHLSFVSLNYWERVG